MSQTDKQSHLCRNRGSEVKIKRRVSEIVPQGLYAITCHFLSFPSLISFSLSLSLSRLFVLISKFPLHMLHFFLSLAPHLPSTYLVSPSPIRFFSLPHAHTHIYSLSRAHSHSSHTRRDCAGRHCSAVALQDTLRGQLARRSPQAQCAVARRTDHAPHLRQP